MFCQFSDEFDFESCMYVWEFGVSWSQQRVGSKVCRQALNTLPEVQTKSYSKVITSLKQRIQPKDQDTDYFYQMTFIHSKEQSSAQRQSLKLL